MHIDGWRSARTGRDTCLVGSTWGNPSLALFCLGALFLSCTISCIRSRANPDGPVERCQEPVGLLFVMLWPRGSRNRTGHILLGGMREVIVVSLMTGLWDYDRSWLWDPSVVVKKED